MVADPGQPSATAAELVLGLLEGAELRAAEARRRDDPAFAAEAARWERHFELWFERWPEAIPPASAREALLRATGRGAANDNPARSWKFATVFSSAVAAALALFITLQPRGGPVDVPVAAPAAERPALMAAALTVQNGAATLPVIIEPARNQLRMPTGIEIPAGRTAQLWLIVGEESPEPLGLLKPSGDGMTAELRVTRAIPVGAILAISIEPAGGSPTGLPTGPVVATGALTQI